MTRLSIQLPDEVTQRAQRLARERGATIDQIICEALEERLHDPHELSEVSEGTMSPPDSSQTPGELNGRRVVTPDMALHMKCPFPYPEPDL